MHLVFLIVGGELKTFMVCGIPGKGYKILLSLAPIVMETILAANFLEKFSVRYFLFDANKKIFLLKEFPILLKLKKEDGLTSASYLHVLVLCHHLLSQT